MKHRRLLQIGLLGAFVLTAVTAHAGWSFKRTGGRQAAALQFATIESWITIKTDMGTPITGDVTMIDEAGKSLWLDDNGDSGELTLSRSGKRFTFQDQVLDNGNLLLGSTVAWQPSPTTDFEELTIGLPEAEYTLFDSVAPGSYQPPPFSEYWSWSGWGPKWSFDPFEARVTLLNTQASQRSVRRGKGWGLDGSGHVLAIYVEDTVEMSDTSGLTFMIRSLPGACFGTEPVVTTNADTALTSAQEAGGMVWLDIGGTLEAGWNWFDIHRDPQDPVCGSLGSASDEGPGTQEQTFGAGGGGSAGLSASGGGTQAATGGNCEPDAPTWDAPPAIPPCDEPPTSGLQQQCEEIGTAPQAECDQNQPLRCNGEGSSHSETFSHTVSANFSVGFLEGLSATFGGSFTREYTTELEGGYCARSYWCEREKTTTFECIATRVAYGGALYSYSWTGQTSCDEDSGRFLQTCKQ